MKNLKKYYYIIIGLFLLSTFLNPLEGIVVNAANDGLSDALNNAPDGISLDNGRFAMPKEDPSGQAYNPGVSSKVISTTGTNPSSRVLQVLNDQYQTGGIWGDPSRNNYVSTNKKQVISMWLNMSKLNGGTDLGDGLAFVLQNDSRKTNAIATAGSKSKINNGESLGVWGNDNYSSEDPSTGAKSVASDAIQNSWALEFDSYPDSTERDTMPDDGSTSVAGLNVSSNTITQNTNAGKVYNSLINGTSDANSFDIGHGRHIASGFPGDSSTYVSHKVKWFKTTNKLPIIGTITSLTNPVYAYYYSQKHTMNDSHNGKYLNESEVNDLFDTGTTGFLTGWHHLTITIDFPGKSISYAFNDKNLDGTAANTNYMVVGEEKLTDADVNGTGRFGKIEDNRLMYGFTGATGPAAMNGLAIFEQIPGFAETSAAVKIKDLSRNKDLASTSDYAYSGERLQLNYNLTYQDGNEPWDKVTSHIILPKNITYSPDTNGNIGSVTVGDKTVEIPSSAITNNVLEFALPSEMNGKTLTTATYSINGIAGDVTQPTTVASAHARFIGDNGITDTDSPSFTIDSPKLKFTPSTALNTTINKGQDAKIEGTVAYTDTNQTLQNSNMVIHTIVNGGSEKLTPMSDTSSVQGQVIDNISHSDLIDGTNTVEVYITDKSDTSIFSNHETFIISTKSGGLSINEYPKSADFQTVNTTRADQIINRSGNWNLSVLDSRDTGNHWRLTASSTKLQNSSSDFEGSLIFKSGNNTSSLTENNVTIVSGETNSNKPITDIDSTWDSDSGGLLKSNGSNAAGTYQGTINWTLYESI